MEDASGVWSDYFGIQRRVVVYRDTNLSELTDQLAFVLDRAAGLDGEGPGSPRWLFCHAVAIALLEGWALTEGEHGKWRDKARDSRMARKRGAKGGKARGGPNERARNYFLSLACHPEFDDMWATKVAEKLLPSVLEWVSKNGGWQVRGAEDNAERRLAEWLRDERRRPRKND